MGKNKILQYFLCCARNVNLILNGALVYKAETLDDFAFPSRDTYENDNAQSACFILPTSSNRNSGFFIPSNALRTSDDMPTA